MKPFTALFTVALFLAGTSITLSSARNYHPHPQDSTHLARRGEWVDDPFIDARDYDSDVFEREFSFDSDDDIFTREELYFWDRSPDPDPSGVDAGHYLYTRGKQQTEAYNKAIKAAGHLEVGKSYAFEVTFPLSATHATIPRGETANEKKLRELQSHLGYSHKALLVGTVTGYRDTLDFAGYMYDLGSHTGTLVTTIGAKEWHPSSLPLTFMGEVRAGLTHPMIEAAATAANADANGNQKRYGFAEWHCGLFADTLWNRIEAH